MGSTEEKMRGKRYYEEKTKINMDSAIKNFLHSRFMQRIFISVIHENGTKTLADKKLLDIGCGDGSRFRPFLEWGMPPENIYAIDISEKVVERAREYSPSKVNIMLGYGDEIPVEDNSMNFILHMGVTTHVLDNNTVQKMADECYRILKTGGLLFLYFSTSDVSFEGTDISHGSRTDSVEEVTNFFNEFKVFKEINCFHDQPQLIECYGEFVFPNHIGKIEDHLLKDNPQIHSTLMVLKK